MLASKPFSQSGLARLALVVLVAGLAVAGCGGSDNTAASGDQQSAAPQVEQDARYWQQLTNLFEPVELASMTDHRAYMLPSGYLLALHFDDMDLEQAANLNWVALGVPGRFCAKDQARVEAEFGQGFTHFHDLEADTLVLECIAGTRKMAEAVKNEPGDGVVVAAGPEAADADHILELIDRH